MRAKSRKSSGESAVSELYVAGSLFGKCPQHIRARLCEIHAWLGKAKFDRAGFREIETADLCETEWNFSSISNPREARSVHEYEHLRECEIAYQYRADYLRSSRSRKAWLRQREAFVKKWPTARSIDLEPGLLSDFFPIPYPLIPSEVRAKLRTDWKPPLIRLTEQRFDPNLDETFDPDFDPNLEQLRTYGDVKVVEEMDFETFKRERPTDGMGIPTGSIPPTFACLQIRGHLAGVDAVESAMLEWLRSIRPKDLKAKRGRAIDTRIQDGLAQLSAWRARRGCLSHAGYLELLSKGGVTGHEFVRRYADTTAFRKAAIAAQSRIATLKARLASKPAP